MPAARLSAESRGPREQGFVLVGVVMFVLALTILGLSLYGLSTYEGQFLTDTQSEEQALFQAEGGMALAQELISVPPYSLSQSHQAEGYEGIQRATAWQINNNLPDSTAFINWSRSVFIRVRTKVGSQWRIVEAEFTPQQRHSPYKRLFTGTTSIAYSDKDASNRSRVGSTTLRGAIWQTVHAASDTSWLQHLDWQNGRPMLTEDAPAPDVSGFLSQHFATAGTAVYADSSGGENKIEFDAGLSGNPAYFKSPRKTQSSMQAPAASNYGFYCTADLELSVRGTAVWLAPTGIRFDNHITIRKLGGSTGTPTLVIVTAPNGTDLNYGDYRDMGLWFFDQGLTVEDNVRVILVSSGHVRMEIASVSGGGGGGGGAAHPGGGDPPGGGGGGGSLNFVLPYLNVFANRITMMGPRSQDGVMNLTYNSSMDALIDDLISRGALPAASGTATGGYTMVAGTWRLP